MCVTCYAPHINIILLCKYCVTYLRAYFLTATRNSSTVERDHFNVTSWWYVSNNKFIIHHVWTRTRDGHFVHRPVTTTVTAGVVAIDNVRRERHAPLRCGVRLLRPIVAEGLLWCPPPPPHPRCSAHWDLAHRGPLCWNLKPTGPLLQDLKSTCPLCSYLKPTGPLFEGLLS